MSQYRSGIAIPSINLIKRGYQQGGRQSETCSRSESTAQRSGQLGCGCCRFGRGRSLSGHFRGEDLLAYKAENQEEAH